MASEEQRIFAGRLFDARCEELKTIKHRAHEACRRYNAMDEFDPQRTEIVRSLLGAIGENGYMQGPIQFNTVSIRSSGGLSLPTSTCW